jgi:excisionase family DNA binding protein
VLLTTSQVAERLGVSAKTVQRLANRGELLTVRPTPKAKRFLSEDVDRFIAERTEEAS